MPRSDSQVFAQSSQQRDAEDLRDLLRRSEVADMPDPSVRLRIGKAIAQAVSNRVKRNADHATTPASMEAGSPAMASKAQQYRDYARDCQETAKRASSDDLRETYEEMARHWLDMAELSEGFQRRHRD